MLDAGRHPNIDLMAYSEVESMEGESGAFEIRICRKARFVNEDQCTGCGTCAEKCPIQVSDSFNMGQGTRSAIYSWFAQGIPSTHTIDAKYCRQLNGKKCGICQKVCQADAIDFNQKDKIVNLTVGAVIVAAGYDIFDPSRIPEYRYRDQPNVITSMEFERLLSAGGPTAGHLNRPSDRTVIEEIAVLEKKAKKSEKMLGKYEEKYKMVSERFYRAFQSGEHGDEKDSVKWADKYKAYLEIKSKREALKTRAERFSTAKNLAFIQCVGSRDFRFYQFCSGYCCMHSIKEAIIAHEHEPETRSVIFGMDIRAVGKGFEEYKIRGGNHSNISYHRGRVAEIRGGPDNHPVVIYEDTISQTVKKEAFDMVILATACAPGKSLKKLASVLDAELDEFGFLKTNHLQPVDTTREGIFVCGCAQSPMDIPESVSQASSAASRAVQVLMTYRKVS